MAGEPAKQNGCNNDQPNRLFSLLWGISPESRTMALEVFPTTLTSVSHLDCRSVCRPGVPTRRPRQTNPLPHLHSRPSRVPPRPPRLAPISHVKEHPHAIPPGLAQITPAAGVSVKLKYATFPPLAQTGGRQPVPRRPQLPAPLTARRCDGPPRQLGLYCQHSNRLCAGTLEPAGGRGVWRQL